MSASWERHFNGVLPTPKLSESCSGSLGKQVHHDPSLLRTRLLSPQGANVSSASASFACSTVSFSPLSVHPFLEGGSLEKTPVCYRPQHQPDSWIGDEDAHPFCGSPEGLEGPRWGRGHATGGGAVAGGGLEVSRSTGHPVDFFLSYSLDSWKLAYNLLSPFLLLSLLQDVCLSSPGWGTCSEPTPGSESPCPHRAHNQEGR